MKNFAEKEAGLGLDMSGKFLTIGVIMLAAVLFFSMSANFAEASSNAPVKTGGVGKINVKSPEFQYNKALGAMDGHYYYNAVQHFQKAIIAKPHFALAWAHMGVALHKLGFPSLAIVSLKKALKYNPNIKWAKITLKKYIASPKR